MTYALDTGNFEGRTQTLYNSDRDESALIIPGLRLLKVPDSVTVDQIQLVRNLPTSGFALFAAGNLTSNLEAIFQRTHAASSTEPIPYRQPFKAASARYQSLEQEWKFLVANNQLAMASNQIPVWNQQAEALGKALAQLAAQPSPQALSHAQTTLNQFRRQFSPWMQQYRQSQPYLVEVWENRLSAIDKLLVYGDRFVLKEKRGS